MSTPKEIRFLRKKIDKITEKIIKLIAERERIVLKIGKIKKERGMPILDLKREKEIRKTIKKLIKKFKASPTTVERVMKILIENGKKLQKR